MVLRSAAWQIERRLGHSSPPGRNCKVKLLCKTRAPSLIPLHNTRAGITILCDVMHRVESRCATLLLLPSKRLFSLFSVAGVGGKTNLSIVSRVRARTDCLCRLWCLPACESTPPTHIQQCSRFMNVACCREAVLVRLLRVI